LDNNNHIDDFLQHPIIKPIVDKGYLSIIQLRPHFNVKQDSIYFDKLHNIGNRSLKLKNIKNLKDVEAKLTKKEWEFFKHTIATFFDVQVTYNLYLSKKSNISFIKGCLYGYKEGNVEPNGNITICHVATNWVIGNVNNGYWDFDKIQAYENKINNWNDCSGCFVQRFCDLCPEKIDGSEKAYTNSRKNFCQFQRKKFRIIFYYALSLCENNPDLWNEVDRLIEETYNKRKKNK
jgi:radical SAM protein with 4Fe4S-binding SPASM domain